MSENTIYLTDFQYRSNKTIIIRNQNERLQFGYSFLFPQKHPLHQMKKMPFPFTENDGFLSVNRRFINYASSIFFKQYSKINSSSSLSLPSGIRQLFIQPLLLPIRPMANWAASSNLPSLIKISTLLKSHST